jgi:hypothetical protein
LKNIVADLLVHFSIDFLENGRTSFVYSTIRRTAARNDLLMCRWQDVGVPMIGEPVVTEVASRFAAPDIFIVVNKAKPMAAEFVRHL